MAVRPHHSNTESRGQQPGALPRDQEWPLQSRASFRQLARALEPTDHECRGDGNPHSESDTLPEPRRWVAESDRVDQHPRDRDAAAVTPRRASERHAADGIGRDPESVPPECATIGPHLGLLPGRQWTARERCRAPASAAASLEQCNYEGQGAAQGGILASAKLIAGAGFAPMDTRRNENRQMPAYSTLARLYIARHAWNTSR